MTDLPEITRPERNLARLRSAIKPSVANPYAMQVRLLELLVEVEAALYEGFENCGFEPDCVWAEPFQKTNALLNEAEEQAFEQ